MNWDFQRSKERLAKEWARIQEAGLNIQRLTREMDLANLSPTDARIVHGAHIYCHFANFSDLIDSPLMRRDDFKRLHRLMHIIRVEQRFTLQQIFDGDKIQVQGPKFHGLLYKPYEDDSNLAWKSILAAIALNLISRDAVPALFPEYPRLNPVSGVSIGDCLVANIGPRNERELISVGAAANYAAKILDSNRALTISPELWSNLSKERRAIFLDFDGVYTLDQTAIGNLQKLLYDEGYAWSAEDSAGRMAATRDSLPLGEISSSEAQVRIEFELLGPKTIKTCSGASLFVDIDGYTAAIDSLLEDEERLGEALQWLHLFRYEMRNVTVDRDAVPVQHQGDRLQALTHLPSNDFAAASRRAVDLCIDYNSSMEEILNEYHAEIGKLHVAIGASFGTTVAIRSGVRGDMDAGCMSKAVGAAERMQVASSGGEISISSSLFEVLDDEVIRDQFKLNEAESCYVAKDLTWTRISDLRKTRNYGAKKSVGFDRSTSGIVFGIGTSQGSDVVPLKQTRPWGIE